ncbi:hypothetical protein QJQ45_017728 [Haematococcus lacustris]|nr:hypothetical protein QJQ45_017728 [Haematococcus lacustris]
MMLTQRTSCHRFPSGHRAHATIHTSLRARKSRCCQTQAIQARRQERPPSSPCLCCSQWWLGVMWTQAQCNDGSHSLVRQVCLASIPTLLASVLLTATALASDGIERDTRVFDGARIIGVEKAQQLDSQLASFEERTGWRLRVFTSYGRDARPSDDTLREVWQPDSRTVIIDFDTSNPNLTKLVHLGSLLPAAGGGCGAGDQVLAKLRRPWWAELQSRFGNLFFIREQVGRQSSNSIVGRVASCKGYQQQQRALSLSIAYPGCSAFRRFVSEGLAAVLMDLLLAVPQGASGSSGYLRLSITLPASLCYTYTCYGPPPCGGGLQGEQAAVLATLDALTTCLERTEGCKVGEAGQGRQSRREWGAVVPGLADDLATSTVALSVAGGLVAGAVTLIEPAGLLGCACAGFVKARWQWLIVFSPLWVSLFINLGLGPGRHKTWRSALPPPARPACHSLAGPASHN